MYNVHVLFNGGDILPYITWREGLLLLILYMYTPSSTSSWFYLIWATLHIGIN